MAEDSGHMRASVTTSAAGKRQAAWSVVLPIVSGPDYQRQHGSAPYDEYIAAVRAAVLEHEEEIAKVMTERYPNTGGE